MSKYLSFGALGTAIVLTGAYNFADRMVTPIPDVESSAVVVGHAGLMAAEAQDAQPMAKFGLGRPATEDEVAAWDIDVRPDGLGLPDGQGSVEDGEVLFTDSCAVCHGDFGEGTGRWPVLAGGQGTLTSDRPNKTIGSYWPYLSTVYDYVNRAMPFGDARSLSADDVYAITAYLLYLNDAVEDDFVLSKDNFTDVTLENEPNFMPDDRATGEIPAFSAEACMENCKETVEITMRAAVVDVTPEDAAAAERVARAMGGLEGGGAAPAAEAAPETVAAAPATEAPAAEAAVPAMDAADPELIALGEMNFRKCKACHQVGENAANKTGPELNAVLGRVAGTHEGFKFSNPMIAAGEEGLIWNEETLAQFLARPRDMIKGTKMSFAGFKSEEEISSVIAYLKTFGG